MSFEALPPAPTPKHAITFSVEDGTGGTLKAEVDGTVINTNGKVEHGKQVTFTAKANDSYRVKSWTLDGKPITEAGTNTEYKLTITKPATVSVSFEEIPPTKYTVTLNQTEHGTVTALPEIPADGKVDENTVITFTADPDKEYKVDKWMVTGGTFDAGTGTDGSPTAKVKVNANTTVTVTFKSVFIPVAYDKLAEYLANTASATEVNYIEVTGLQAEHLKGDDSEHDPEPSPLGAILQAHPTKKVALKLGGSVSALMAMPLCFYNCTSLVGVAAIPKGVKDMTDCFDSCKSLTQAPAIPEGVKDMSYCFRKCTSLKKAPASIPASVTNMSQCFEKCASLTEVPTSIPASVTDMSSCFLDCTSLTQGPAISEGVKNMSGCFRECTRLTEVPAIPASITEMSGCFFNCKALTSVTLKCNYSDDKFGVAFKNCTALGEKSIKVPQSYYGNYTTAEALNRMAVPGDNDAEKKAKFEGV